MRCYMYKWNKLINWASIWSKWMNCENRQKTYHSAKFMKSKWFVNFVNNLFHMQRQVQNNQQISLFISLLWNWSNYMENMYYCSDLYTEVWKNYINFHLLQLTQAEPPPQHKPLKINGTIQIILDLSLEITWAMSWENLFMSYANNKGADAQADLHLCCSLPR